MNDVIHPYRWQPGQSGNPTGRPVGSRHRFGERFMADAFEVWKQYGKIALEHMAQHEPCDYVKAMVVALPKNVVHETASEIDRLTSEEARELLDWIRTMKAKKIEAVNE